MLKQCINTAATNIKFVTKSIGFAWFTAKEPWIAGGWTQTRLPAMSTTCRIFFNIMSAWKLLQRRCYDILSYKYSLLVILVAFTCIFIGIIHFGEVRMIYQSYSQTSVYFFLYLLIYFFIYLVLFFSYLFFQICW